MLDGMIRIGTKLETKELEKNLKDAEKELKQFEKETDKLINKKIEIQAEVNLATQKYEKQISDLRKNYQRAISPAFAGGYGPSEERKLAIAKEYDEKLKKINQDYYEQIKPLTEINEKIKESVNNQDELKSKIKDINKELNRNKNLSDFSKTMKQGFESTFKSAKKLVIGIIGVRAAYSLVRKATSAYLATDSKTTAQMEANWTGLGAIMGPVVEWLTQLMKKAVTAVLHFMSVLTGENYIAKANAAILKKQTKATNDLTKATDKYTASFDEMNVISDNSVSGGYDSSNITASLFDINDLSEKTRETIENIAKALQPVYEMLKEIVKFALDHPEVIIGILGGAALLTMLGKIIGFAGAGTAIGTGLAGILGILLAIASIGVITISFKKVIEETGKFEEEQEDAEKTLEGNIEATDELRKKIYKLTQAEKEGTKVANQSASTYKMLNNTSADHVKMLIEEGLQTKGFNKLVNITIGRTESLGNQIKLETDAMFKNIVALNQSYKAGKLDEQGKKDYFDALTSLTNITEIASLSTMDLAKNFVLTKEESEELKTQYNIAATELYRMYKNGDTLIDTLDRMPKEVRTQIESNFDKNLDLLDNVYATLEKIPGYKRIDVETKVTADTSSAKSTLEKLFGGMSKTLSIFDEVMGTNLSYKFSQIRLAQGGIVNNPGRGVSIGSNIIAGENGPEAVLPLTDDTLQRLANMIPINVNVVNTMNGRVISRELQKVQNDSDFAYNR